MTALRSRLTKLWKADGSIAQYDDAATFRHREETVSSLHALGELLSALEQEPRGCILRGGRVSAGATTKRNSTTFVDRPLSWLMIDFDKVETMADPLIQPAAAFEEAIRACLPEPFHMVAFYWQLSGSMGHPSKPGLNGHAWFWLAEPLTSAEAKAYLKANATGIDPSVYGPAAIHYTAAPLAEPGVVIPVTLRSGLESGLDDAVLIPRVDIEASLPRRQKKAVSAPVVPVSLERIASMLPVFDRYTRDNHLDLLPVILGIHAATGGSDAARALVVERLGDDAGEVERFWDNARLDRPDGYTIGTVEMLARQRQWVDPDVLNAFPIVDNATGAAEADRLKPRDQRVANDLAECRARYVQVQIGKLVLIFDPRAPSWDQAFMTVETFRTMLAGRWHWPDRDDAKPIPLANAWLLDVDREQRFGIDFAPPPAIPDPNTLNLWRGFAVEPKAGDVSPWIEAMMAMIPNRQQRRYVLRWLAWKVQNPGSVPGTLLILIGQKGTGKNALFSPVLDVFRGYSSLMDNPEQIVGRFNWHLMSLIFAVLDEAVFVGDPRQMDVMKSRVTGTQQTYEQKGMTPMQGTNRMAVVMLTNHGHAWQASNDERRAVPLEVAPALMGDRAFWRRYWDWANSPESAPAVLHLLQSVDLSRFDVRAIPKTADLQRQIEQTELKDPAVAWWAEVLTEGRLNGQTTVGVDGLYRLGDEATEVPRHVVAASWELARSRHRGGRAPEFHVVAKRLVDWTGAETVRRRVDHFDRERRYVFAPLDELRARFTAATGVGVDDGEGAP